MAGDGENRSREKKKRKEGKKKREKENYRLLIGNLALLRVPSADTTSFIGNIATTTKRFEFHLSPCRVLLVVMQGDDRSE